MIDWQKLKKKLPTLKNSILNLKNHPFAKKNHLNQTTIVFKMWIFQGVKCKIDSLGTWKFMNFRAPTRFELNAKTVEVSFFSKISLAPTLKSRGVQNFSTYKALPNGFATRGMVGFGLETLGAGCPPLSCKNREILMENARLSCQDTSHQGMACSWKLKPTAVFSWCFFWLLKKPETMRNVVCLFVLVIFSKNSELFVRLNKKSVGAQPSSCCDPLLVI